MLKLTVDKIFPMHSLKRKRTKPVGESPSPVKTSVKNKKKSQRKKSLGKIEEEAFPGAEEPEEREEEPVDPE